MVSPHFPVMVRTLALDELKLNVLLGEQLIFRVQ